VKVAAHQAPFLPFGAFPRDPRGLDGHTNPAVTDAFVALWSDPAR
jgi:hypothetical protein